MSKNGVRFPRFVKVFLSETDSESYSIPESCTEHLAVPLPPKAKLQGIGGGTWRVSMSLIREVAYFTTGWSKFAEEHEVKSGEYLHFVYDGNRTFEVSVLGLSSCKEIRAVPQVVHLLDSDSSSDSEEEISVVHVPQVVIDLSYSNSEEEETPMDDDQELSQCVEHLGSEETDDDNVDDELASSGGQEMSQRFYHVEREENDTATEVLAGNSVLDISNPCFDTKLEKRCYELLIPAHVINQHSLTFQDAIIYIDEEGSTRGERGGAYDGVCFRGWDMICHRNKLKKNDTVTCELLHTRKEVHSIRIRITRGTA